MGDKKRVWEHLYQMCQYDGELITTCARTLRVGPTLSFQLDLEGPPCGEQPCRFMSQTSCNHRDGDRIGARMGFRWAPDRCEIGARMGTAWAPVVRQIGARWMPDRHLIGTPRQAPDGHQVGTSCASERKLTLKLSFAFKESSESRWLGDGDG